MEALHQKIKNWKLKTKFLLILSVALTLVFCITFFTARMPYEAYDAQLYRSKVQTISLFSDKLQSEMDVLTNLSFQVLSDNVLQKNLTLLRKTPLGTNAWIEARDTVSKRIGYYAYNAKDVLSFRFVTAQGMEFYYAFGEDGMTEDEKEAMARAVADNNGREAWMTFPGNPMRLMLARNVREVDSLTLKSLGTLMIHVDFERIVERCLKAMEALGCPLSAAIYEGDTCLYASDGEIVQLGMGEDGYKPVQLDGRQVLCVRFTSWHGWRFVTALPYDEIMADIRTASHRAIFFSLLAVLLALGISALLMTSMLRHLNILIRKFDAFAIGAIPTQEESMPYIGRRDEIGRLHRHFDRMAREYDRVTRENYDKQLLLQEAKMRQLRAQIRPHFLYNTLESIYCLAKFSGEERIATMTDALGKMLRATLSDKRDIIPVREDMQIANEYLRIQLLRYEDRLRVECMLHEAVLPVLIPSMTLQPLIENAVHHAAEEMADVCVIRLFDRPCEDGIEIVVEDNGPGMEEDMLEKLERGEVKPDGLGIGLRNIHQRIQLEFSRAYGLRIRRLQGRTQVIVHLPGCGEEGDTHV